MNVAWETDDEFEAMGALSLEDAARIVGTIGWIDPRISARATGRTTYVIIASMDDPESRESATVEVEDDAEPESLAMLEAVRSALAPKGTHALKIGDLTTFPGKASAYFDLSLPASASARATSAGELPARRAELAAFLRAAGLEELALKAEETPCSP